MRPEDLEDLCAAAFTGLDPLLDHRRQPVQKCPGSLFWQD